MLDQMRVVFLVHRLDADVSMYGSQHHFSFRATAKKRMQRIYNAMTTKSKKQNA